MNEPKKPIEVKIYNPTDQIFTWETEYENNSFVIVISPHAMVLVRKELVERLLNKFPDLINKTAEENNPDYFLKREKTQRWRWLKRIFRYDSANGI